MRDQHRADLLASIYPNARAADLEDLAGPLFEAMSHFGIASPLEQAHFLSQVGHETGELQWREELASGDAYDTRTDLGNTRARDGDGRLYKGRGGLMLTGRANYEDYDDAIGAGGWILRQPKKLTEPLHFANSAAWYWHARGLGKLARQDNLKAVTRRINGGYNGLSDRQRLLFLAKQALLSNQTKGTVDLQLALNRVMRAGLAVDGSYGPKTRRAVRDFQKIHGLVVDGEAGRETWEKLRELL